MNKNLVAVESLFGWCLQGKRSENQTSLIWSESKCSSTTTYKIKENMFSLFSPGDTNQRSFNCRKFFVHIFDILRYCVILIICSYEKGNGVLTCVESARVKFYIMFAFFNSLTSGEDMSYSEISSVLMFLYLTLNFENVYFLI